MYKTGIDARSIYRVGPAGGLTLVAVAMEVEHAAHLVRLLNAEATGGRGIRSDKAEKT